MDKATKITNRRQHNVSVQPRSANGPLRSSEAVIRPREACSSAYCSFNLRLSCIIILN